VKSIITFVILVLVSLSWASLTAIGNYRVNLRTEPDLVPVGRAKVHLTITSMTGQPISAATVKVLVQMPGMPMGEKAELASPASQPGEYIAPVVFAMQGRYEAHVSIQGSAGAGDGMVQLETGMSSQSEGGTSVLTIGIYFLVIFIAVFALRLIGLANVRRGAVSIVVLLVVLGSAIYGVNHFRRSGAMTPLEAQVMDMNAPAPEGKLPVELVSVSDEDLAPSIHANGQILGYQEQTVNARVAGAIVWMPGYIGDHVSKGQVIVRLDTSLLDPMVAEKQAQTFSASNGIVIAQNDYRRALADVTQARSEEAIRVADVEESTAMVQASEQERLAAEATIQSDQALVRDAQSQDQAARAERYYWSQELERAKSLFAKGALSRDEFQKTQSMSQSVIERVKQTQAGLDAANAKLQGSRAIATKAKLEVAAAESRLNSMKAEHHAHMAHVQSAQAMAESAKARIGQATAETLMARAGLAGAQAQRGYAEIRAETDGVITDRLVSPGVVVAPGQAVLKIAQIRPVRVQVNLTEADLAKVRIGADLLVQDMADSSHPIKLVVSSKAPSVDPVTRLGIVEALYQNNDDRLKPGQYISAQVNLGLFGNRLTVPASAIQSRENQSVVWLAQPGSAGEYVLARTIVTVGVRSHNKVEILSGLKLGDKVVDNPSLDLESGVSVTSSSRTSPNDTNELLDQTIEITSAGYSPQEIQAPVGKPFRLNFIRRDAQSCGTQVIFKDLGIKRDLPLNQKVTIDIPALKPGQQLSFTCPMNMLNGKAVAQ